MRESFVESSSTRCGRCTLHALENFEAYMLFVDDTYEYCLLWFRKRRGSHEGG